MTKPENSEDGFRDRNHDCAGLLYQIVSDNDLPPEKLATSLLIAACGVSVELCSSRETRRTLQHCLDNLPHGREAFDA